VPRLGEFYPGICLTTGEKARKNLTQVKKKPQSEYSMEPNEKSSIQEGDGFDCWIKNHSYIIFILFL